MSFIRRNMIHEIAYRVPTGRDGNGDFLAAGPILRAPARVEARVDKVRGPDGNEVITTHRIYTGAIVPMSATMWVPMLGDDVANDNHGRRPLAISNSEQLRGGDRLCTVYM